MVKVCRYCGASIPADSFLCSSCGRKSTIFHEPEHKPSQTIIPTRRTTKPHASTKVILQKAAASKPIQVDPEALTSDEVLQRFPSPSLRPYQREIIVRIVEAFQTGKKCVILAAPTGFGKCLLSGERVFAKNGLIQMKNVLAKDDPNFRTDAFPIGRSKTMRVTTRHGYSLQGGNQHRVVVFDGEFKWKQLCELKVGDCVPITYLRGGGEAIPLERFPYRYSNTGSIPSQVSLSKCLEEPLAELLGVYLADGSVTSANVHIASKKMSVREEIAKIADQYEISVSFHPEDIVLNSVHIARFVRGLIGEGAYTKQVPNQVFRAKEDVRVAFLRGYFKGDGYYDRALNVSEFFTVSHTIAQNVQLLLLSLGIFSTLARKRGRYNGHCHLSWRVTVSGSQNVKLLRRMLGIQVTTNSVSSWERIPLINGKVNSVLKEYVRRKRIAYRSNAYRNLKTMESYAYKEREPTRQTLLTYLNRMKLVADMPEYQNLVDVASANCLFDYVKRIENLGETEVYEISCRNGTYIAQGFISHNSYVNAAFTSVTHSFYATPQLALLDQIKNDPYLEGRFVEVSGRQNYQCYYQPNRRVNVGKCETEDYACKERYEVCPYWIQKMHARNAPSVLTTLAYLISEGQTEDRSDSYLGNRKLLVLDEAHNLEDQCLNHISLRLGPFTLPHEIYEEVQPELERLESDAQVKELVVTVSERLENLLEKSKMIAETSGLSIAQVEDRNRTEQFLASYELYKTSRSEWVWQVRNNQLLLQPVFGREFVRQLVWKRAEHYIISSATILDSHEFAELTGLLDFLTEDQVTSLSLPSKFPVANRPVIDAMVGPLSRQEWETNMPKAVRMVEEILRKEPGNVAIHCHSYRHQKVLAENISKEFSNRLIVHTSRDREDKLYEWMHSRGKVFVSVAFNEGQDWKYDVCDAQVLLKVPFPDLSDKRVKRRLNLGHRKWYENQAMLEVIQAYGRAIRAEDDSARFYIVDGSFTRLLKSRWDSIPDWFKEALPDNAS